jgi:hypothetical protein
MHKLKSLFYWRKFAFVYAVQYPWFVSLRKTFEFSGMNLFRNIACANVPELDI